MSNLEIHCKISKLRTRNEFRELHQWMDEGIKYLKHDHRLERHFFIQEYKDFIKEKWGGKAVVEWLFHIALDNLETANKFAVQEYNKAFEEISISFGDKEISGCKFIKKFPNSNKTFEIDLKGRVRERAKIIDKEGERYTKEELMLMGFDEIEAELFSGCFL